MKKPVDSSKAKTDRQLGMNAAINRRDFVQGAGLAALGLGLAAQLPAVQAAGGEPAAAVALTAANPQAYPPTRTGLRGSHPGAFEAAHRLARERRGFPAARELEESYDLIVVGGGISGLAAAHYYQQRFGKERRILILENHDDFGGHARRNEFHQGGKLRLSLGGTHNLEWWNFSATVNEYMQELGVDVARMRENMQFDYGRDAKGDTATWFDAETYGVDRLVKHCDLSDSAGLSPATVDALPLSAQARAQLKAFYAMRRNVLAGKTQAEVDEYLASISYPTFLRTHAGLGDEALQLFNKLQHGGWAVEITALSARECLGVGLPGEHLLGGEPGSSKWDYPVAMWPDGNASLARLQLMQLMPDLAPESSADNIALAQIDYSRLDRAGSVVRLRLNSTVVAAGNTDSGVAVTYVNDGSTWRVKARHAVMACYHAIIPHLCPTLPFAQREAMSYQVKRPLLLTNVLIRSARVLDDLGIDAVICPGRMHGRLFAFRGINTGGYQHPMDDDGPVSLVFWGSISPPAGISDVKAQHRASRTIMLGLDFADYEREVRTVLDGLLGPAGFDVASDILAITVNRWPHGYAYDYLDLWDEDWEPGQAPHEIARQPFGNITMANSDAAADAYTHAAIDQAYRAVQELPAVS